MPSLRKIWDNDKVLNPQNFHIIKPNSSIKDLFDVKMDFIFANQSLYYLTNSSFKNTINEFYDILKKNGIDVNPDIMIPLTTDVKELKYVKQIVIEEAEKIQIN